MPFKVCPEKDPSDTTKDQCVALGSPLYIDAAQTLEYGTVQLCLCSQETEWDAAFTDAAFDVAAACTGYPHNFQADLSCPSGTETVVKTDAAVGTGTSKTVRNMCYLSAAATKPAISATCADVFPLNGGQTSSDIADYDGYLVSMKLATLGVVETIVAGETGTAADSVNVCHKAGTAAQCRNKFGAQACAVAVYTKADQPAKAGFCLQQNAGNGTASGGDWAYASANKRDTYIYSQQGNWWACYAWNETDFPGAITATATKLTALSLSGKTACTKNVLVVESAAPARLAAATAAGAHVGYKKLASTTTVIKFQTSKASDDWAGSEVRLSPDEGVKLDAYLWNPEVDNSGVANGDWKTQTGVTLKGSLSGLATSCIAAGALIANMF